jgi:hypothetical protein
MLVLFYHGIGVLIMLVGSFAIKNIISGYEEPSRPVSLSIASELLAEPIEEILFFGILFCTPGNPLV